MNLFNVMKERLTDLNVFGEVEVFYNALLFNKENEVIKDLVSLCESNYFKIHYNQSNNINQYDVGVIIVEFDDENKLYPYTYTITLSYVSSTDTYLPKIKIEKNELLTAFVDAK